MKQCVNVYFPRVQELERISHRKLAFYDQDVSDYTLYVFMALGELALTRFIRAVHVSAAQTVVLCRSMTNRVSAESA